MMKNLYMKYIAGSLFEKKRSNAVARLYFQDLVRIVDIMKPYLPAKCKNVLDIGCGLGGLDVLIFREYTTKNNPIELWLLDRDDDSPVYERHYTGFRQEAAAYNSLMITRKFMLANGVPSNCINLVNIAEDKFPSNQDFDLVISYLAWGFHFPVEAYLDSVKHSLRKGGVLFIDIRKDTDGVDKLKSCFHDVKILDIGKKNMFVIAQYLH